MSFCVLFLVTPIRRFARNDCEIGKIDFTRNILDKSVHLKNFKSCSPGRLKSTNLSYNSTRFWCRSLKKSPWLSHAYVVWKVANFFCPFPSWDRPFFLSKLEIESTLAAAREYSHTPVETHRDILVMLYYLTFNSGANDTHTWLHLIIRYVFFKHAWSCDCGIARARVSRERTCFPRAHVFPARVSRNRATGRDTILSQKSLISE